MKPFFDQSIHVLLELRFIRAIDIVFAAMWCIGATIFTTHAILRPSPSDVYTLMFCLITGQMWSILLIFRTAYYVLNCRADINLMTANAAKLVHAYQLGPQPPSATTPQ